MPYRAWLVASLVAITSYSYAESLSDMTSPRVDDPAKPWCYLAKSTTVIGVPFQPDVTQVTYDGALYTGSAELCFFYGSDRQPIFARQKSFLEGWIPIVQYHWNEGAIRYDYEAFAQSLPGEDASNTVNFVRLTMTNDGVSPSSGTVWAGYRHRYDNSRFGGSPFDPNWKYLTSDTAAYRDGALVYSFPKGGRSTEAANEIPLNPAKPVDAQTVEGLVGYRRTLNPGQAASFIFKMPRVPVPATAVTYLEKLAAADYGVMRAKTVAWWRNAVIGNTRFHIPEPEVENAQRASLVHMLLATRERDHRRFQTDGLPYPDLFLTSNVQAEMAYDFLGRPHDYEIWVPEVLRRQNPEGIFMDTSLPQNADPLIAAQGQTLHALSYHAVVTHDVEFGRRVFPAVSKGVKWIRRAHEKDPYGLMPPSWPYDNEMILGRYTSHNLWCLLGVRSAIRLARLLGETKTADLWTQFEKAYRASIVKALHASARPDGSIPPGLYEYKTGDAARAGFKEYQTGQEWENMLLAEPTEVLDPQDPLLTATLARLHAEKFREGVMSYRNGQHLHQYITANVLEQEMARGDERQALTDLYHMLLHNGPTHEGFENLVEPWTRQVSPDCPPPHAWAAMKTALVIRNMLLVEQGGDAGLDESKRDLHLFSLISPAWIRPGASVGFTNAPCEMGKISANLAFRQNGATLSLDAHWRWKPRDLVMRIPWFVKLDGYTANSRIRREGNTLRIGPDATLVNFRWSIRPGAFGRTLQDILLAYRREPFFRLVNGEGVDVPPPAALLSTDEERLPPTPLSFASVLDAYRREYIRRFRLYEAAGGTPVYVTPPQ